MTGLPASDRKRAWLWVAGLSVAMLVLPLLGWLLLPVPEVAAPEPVARRPVVPEVVDEPVEETAPPAELRAVTGMVVDQDTKPLAGVQLRVEVAGKSISAGSTGSDGSFRLPAPTSAGVLVAQKSGYAGSTAEVPASSEDVELELVLQEAEALRGRVVSPEGRPVANAMVRCEDSDDPLLSVSTDTEGNFEMEPDAAGCKAVATHASYGPSDPVVIKASGMTILRLAGPGGIAGNVYDERGSPLGSFVCAIESFRPLPGRPGSRLGGSARSFTNPDGSFEIERLEAGQYVLTFSAEGRPPVTSDPIEVEPGRTTTGVRITLPGGATLIGTVLDRDTGAAVSGAKVALDGVTWTGASAVAPGTSDEAGVFTIEGVPNERFSIRIEHPEYRDTIVPGLQASGGVLRQTFRVGKSNGEDSTEFTGIGAMLAPNSAGGVRVAMVMDDGPAKAAGVEQGDRVLRVDGQDVSSSPLPLVVQKLRGAPGSRVTLTVDREGETQSFVITRDTIVR